MTDNFLRLWIVMIKLKYDWRGRMYQQRGQRSCGAHMTTMSRARWWIRLFICQSVPQLPWDKSRCGLGGPRTHNKGVGGIKVVSLLTSELRRVVFLNSSLSLFQVSHCYQKYGRLPTKQFIIHPLRCLRLFRTLFIDGYGCLSAEYVTTKLISVIKKTKHSEIS